MASILHEAVVLLFHNEPALAPLLAARARGMDVPEHSTVTLEDAALTEVVPTEYRADGVVVLRHDETAVHAFALEVQLRRDADKAYTWPQYAVSVRARLRCPTSVLVVTPSARVAHWASRPIELDGDGGSVFRPLVVGPDRIPRVTDVDEARRCPELAVLSALAHARAEGAVDVGTAALAAATGLDDQRATLYGDLILEALGPAARAALEGLMATGYTYRSEFAKEYFAQGYDQGLEQGRERGREQGIEEGMRAVLMRQLRQWGVDLDAADEARVAGAGLSVLERIADDVAAAAGDPAAVRDALRRHLR